MWQSTVTFNAYYARKIPCENEEVVVRTPAVGNDGLK